MTDDEKFAGAVRDAVRDPDPPTVPREEMWARIQQTRQAPAVRRVQRRGLKEWTRWALPLAAALALGIALGRYSAPGRATPDAFVEAPPAAMTEPAAGPALPYVLATVQHLARTEELLASLPDDARGAQADEVAGWARDLLTNTRLLMSSPVSADPQLAALLEDLELILAQIAALPAAPPAAELQLIEDGIERNDMMGRLRAATNERPIFGT